MKQSKINNKYLLIASTEAYSGKSATVIGIGSQLQQKGLLIGYAKPIGAEKTENIEEDVNFISENLKLSVESVYPPVVYLSPEKIKESLKQENQPDYGKLIESNLSQSKESLIIIEGPENIYQGSLYDISVPQIANLIKASVLIVTAYDSLCLLDNLIKVKQDLGENLLGVVINDIPLEASEEVSDYLQPFLQKRGIEILGKLPRNKLLKSISVREISKQLKAKVLCREDRLDLMVENLAIGAMNVNSAMQYFRKRQNKAVVTGSDRTDVQLAAIESSTHCLILTGHTPPQSLVLNRAEDLEIPILLVNLDTLSTVEIIENIFGKVRIKEPIKVKCIQELFNQHFDIERLISKLGIQLPITN